MSRDNPLDLQDVLGLKFKTPDLLVSALTHRSHRAYYPKVKKKVAHYERLEFLGDAVLDLVISEWLMEKYPKFDEGQLSQLRAQLVNRDSLSTIATNLGLEKYLRLGRGEHLHGVRGRLSILADVFEALVGAVYLDRGFEAVRTFVVKTFVDFTDHHFNPEEVQDYKSLLQEWTQSNELRLPYYRLIVEEGPDHAKNFTVRCELKSGDMGEGTGFNKKQAEQRAARDVLTKIGLLERDH